MTLRTQERKAQEESKVLCQITDQKRGEGGACAKVTGTNLKELPKVKQS